MASSGSSVSPFPHLRQTTSNQDVVSDATILLRDMAGDAAQKAADRVNPSEDELNQLDDEAEENTWHDVPKMSRDDLKNKVKNKYQEQKPFSREDLKEAGRDATQAAHPSGSRDPRDAADLAARDQRQGTSSGMDAQHGAKTAINSLRDRAEQNMPEDTKDRARNYRDRTKNYMKEKLPQERRDQIIHRMKKMVVEIQGHQDCTFSQTSVMLSLLTLSQISVLSIPSSAWLESTGATPRTSPNRPLVPSSRPMETTASKRLKLTSRYHPQHVLEPADAD